MDWLCGLKGNIGIGANLADFRNKILDNQPRYENNQKKFNLGNGNLFENPLAAAEFLLKREYEDSFLFDHKNRNLLLSHLYLCLKNMEI